MADRRVDFLIVGGGIAGGACAAELRKRGAEGEILLVGREPDPPYDRPPLSKEYLRGEAAREDALFKPAEWYAENGVELLTRTSVLSLDTGSRTAKLQTKEEVAFERALIATGSMVNILRVGGSRLAGIHYLRAFGNADAIREDAKDAERVVLIGGSYIACECAASLTAQGRSCTLVMMEDVALSNSFGEEVGRWFHHLLERKGVEILGGETLAAFVGPEGEEGARVRAVRTQSGNELPADLVIVGAGVRPDLMLAQKAGLEVDNGVVCDEKLETSVEGIFAAGDICSYPSRVHGGKQVRIEHWDLAFKQGQAAAANMLGEGEPFDEVPYFWSDLADWASLEYIGPAYDWDEVVWRGDSDEGKFSAFYLSGGKVAGALSVERGEDLMEARRLLAEGVDVGERTAELANVEFDLSEL